MKYEHSRQKETGLRRKMKTQREQTKWDKRQKGRDWKTSHCMPINSDQGRRSVPSSDLSLLDSRVEPRNKAQGFTCCKCFPTACMLTLVRPVSCVWPLVDLSLKQKHECFLEALCRKMVSTKTSSSPPTAELYCCLYIIFERQKVTFLKNY